MMRRRGSSTRGRFFRVALAGIVLAALLYISGRGVGPVPPLGEALNPGTGVWTMAVEARRPTNQTLHLPGLRAPVQILFEQVGTAHIQAATNGDLWLANGYLNARFRLTEMDLLRRQGEGLLSQIVGGAALTSDKFELKLGLRRTAQVEWQQLPAGSAARAVLLAYARGVNDGIAEVEAAHHLPTLFKLLGYEPARWTPIDSLVIQGDETQTLSFSDQPLDYALLARSLGYQRTMRWFPVLAANRQYPYDSGRYHRQNLTPLPAQARVSSDTVLLAATLAGELAALPAGAVHRAGNSNNWAVGGSHTASGLPLLAGDPHLHQTLPAIWYQFSADSPNIHINGVGIPGTPGIVIGRNRHISWSLTDTQNQSTLFYIERTDPARPHQYYWRGAWRTMRRLIYHIPIKGGVSTSYEVDLTVHGPITASRRVPGKSIAIYWTGALPSADITALLGIEQANNWNQFKNALHVWHAPTQNFVYADDGGHIGLIAPGYYPITHAATPWLPMTGTGAADVVGSIPFTSVPQVYDPPSQVVFSANQRPVGGSYPYYIGTSYDSFANGYRAARIQQVLSAGHGLRPRDMERLQNDVHDYLAALIVPKLLSALRGASLNASEHEVRTLLRGWDTGMRVNSPSASIWWTFWQRYLHDTFDPWWSVLRVPSNRFHSVRVNTDLAPLNEDLESWTLHDPTNPAFSSSGNRRRAASAVMLLAFHQAVSQLSSRLGGSPANWRWGRIHTRRFESLAQISALDYGPHAASGNQWTVNAADGGSTSTAGPSWRFIMDWSTGSAEGVYPGGQSENPLSPWYQNQIEAWWQGRYFAMRDYAAAVGQSGVVRWLCRP